MAGLNAILAKINAPFAAVAGGDSGVASPPLPQQGPDAQDTDRFLAGQHWQNRAGSEGTGAGFRGGSYAAYVAKVYAGQAAEQPGTTAAGGREGTEEAAEGETSAAGTAVDEPEQGKENARTAGTGTSQVKGLDGEPLSSAEVAQLAELKKADTAVRAHEQAHLAAAGGLAKSGASYSYSKGPDGHKYAVAGEVQIDTSKGTTPEQTVAKMARVRAAALAPANPSPQDRKVAQAAAATMSEARLELNTEKVRPEEEQEKTQESAASESTEGGADGNSAGAAADGTTPDSRKSSFTARAVSRYQAAARLQNGLHLAV